MLGLMGPFFDHIFFRAPGKINGTNLMMKAKNNKNILKSPGKTDLGCPHSIQKKILAGSDSIDQKCSKSWGF